MRAHVPAVQPKAAPPATLVPPVAPLAIQPRSGHVVRVHFQESKPRPDQKEATA